MLQRIGAGLVAISLAASAGPAAAETFNFRVHARVPVACQVQHRPAPVAGGEAGAVPLGQLNEFCNAPGGYTLVVSYTPGTLQGTVLRAGEDEVVLDGSGQTVLSRAAGPRIRERPLYALPGPEGFDTSRLQIDINPV